MSRTTKDTGKNLPEGWKLCRLKDIGEIVSGGTPSTKEQSFWGDDINWITPADLSGYSNKYIAQGRKSITEKGLKSSSAKLLPKGTVLFSSRAPIGYVAIASEELSTNQGFKNIIPSPDISNEYLYYYLKSAKDLAEKYSSGTTFKEICASAFKELPIPVPPTDVQQRIVSKVEELFSELDKSIEQLKTAQRQLKVYRQAVLKWAFEGRLTSENVDGELPETWAWVNLDFLLDKKRKGMTTGPFGTMLRKSEHKENGIPVLGIENIGQGVFKTPNKIFVDLGKARELQNFRVKADDVIISRSGTVGEICLVPDNMDNSIISTNLLRISLRRSVIIPKYFVYLFQGGRVRDQVLRLCKGSSRAFLNQTILATLNFPFCHISEQNKVIQEIETRLSVADNVEIAINNSLRQAEALKQSILKRAFQGSLW